MLRRSTSPMPAVSTLVTGTRTLFIDAFDHGTRIDHGALTRAGESQDVAIDDVVEHDDAARIADAAGIIGLRHTCGAWGLAAACDLGVLRNLPRAVGSFGLRHRSDAVAARAHRVEHRVD